MEIHFLNVKEGDCSIIEHDSGRVSMIDICCGNIAEEDEKDALKEAARISFDSMEHVGLRGDFKQRLHPVNPVEWLGNELRRDKNLNFFRFISTHPDMDHLDGIEALFKRHRPAVFWDTENSEEKEFESPDGKYKESDWRFYSKLHSCTDKMDGIQVLRLHAGARGQYYNRDDGIGEGDRISILSPSKRTDAEAEKQDSVNDFSYVLLVRNASRRKFLFAGDSEKIAWDIMLDKYKGELSDIDVLFAPHHGRKSGGNDDYLDVLNPKVTFFGNAKSKDLDDDTFNRKGLLKFSNNQLGSIVLTEENGHLYLWGSNKTFVDKWRIENQQKLSDVTRCRGGKRLYWLKEI